MKFSTKYGSYNFFNVSKNIFIIYIPFIFSFIEEFLFIFSIIISFIFSLYIDIPKHFIKPDKQYKSPKLTKLSFKFFILSINSSNIFSVFSFISLDIYSKFLNSKYNISRFSILRAIDNNVSNNIDFFSLNCSSCNILTNNEFNIIKIIFKLL